MMFFDNVVEDIRMRVVASVLGASLASSVVTEFKFNCFLVASLPLEGLGVDVMRPDDVVFLIVEDVWVLVIGGSVLVCLGRLLNGIFVDGLWSLESLETVDDLETIVVGVLWTKEVVIILVLSVENDDS